MNVGKNARLTPQGRRLIFRQIEDQDWTEAAAPDAARRSVR